MTRLEQKRFEDILWGQMTLARAQRHIVNRTAVASQSGRFDVPYGPYADACKEIGLLWLSLEAERKCLRKKCRSRKRSGRTECRP